MKKVLLPIVSVCSLFWLALAAFPLQAHHSFSMFDQSRKITIEGKISDIQWTNPHTWIYVDVAGDDGEVVTWGIELTSKVHLTRRGFPIDQLSVGDDGTFAMSPYADGRPGGRFWSLETTKGVVHRDPGAQREFERTQAANSQ